LRDEVTLTREHVFARWLVERLRAWRATHAAHRVGEAARDARIATLVAEVCGVCNAGWMSGLEVSFRQAVFAQTRPERLAEPTRRVLSRWFAKTATLVADATGAELIPVTEWPALTTAMPANIRVGLARLRHPRQPLDLALEYAGAEAEHEASRLVSVAVQVGDLVGTVTAGSPIIVRGTTLWPIRSHVLRWTTLPVVNRIDDGRAAGATRR
jgi:hypothetical protein